MDGGEARQDHCQLSDLLEKLNSDDDNSPSVSHWNSAYNDSLIRKYFKVVRRLVSAEDFCIRYFWARQTVLFEKWQTSSDVQGLLTFAETATAAIDTNENELFLPGNVEPHINREQISEEISNGANQLLGIVDHLKLNNKTMSMSILLNGPQGYNIETQRYSENALQMRTGLHRWMMCLSRLVEHSPANIKQQAYQKVFEKYLEAFCVECVNGDMEPLGIPYRNGQVSCVPDLLLCTGGQRSCYAGVVQVKRMTLDPSFKHAFDKTPKQGILRDEAEGATPAKKRCVDFSLDEGKSDNVNIEATEKTVQLKQKEESHSTEKTVHFEQKEESHHDSEDDHESNSASASTSKMGGSEVPDWVKNLMKTFFGELFGSVLALDFHQSADKNKQRLGIGVVGFRVIFFTFYARPNISFSKIPEQPNSRMEVYMTRPLCILKASDRAEISKILLQVAVKKPLKSLS